MDTTQLTECVREFKLQRKYPSIAPKPTFINIPIIKVETMTSLQLLGTKTRYITPVDMQRKNGFHKLRLKSPSGKDLGEVNVKMLSFNNNIVKSKTLINQNKYKNLNKSSILSNIISKEKENKLVTIVPFRSMNVNKNINILKLENTISFKKNNSNIDEKCKDKTVILKNIDTTDGNHKKQNTNTTNMDIDKECYNNEESKCNQIPNINSKDVSFYKTVLKNISKIVNYNPGLGNFIFGSKELMEKKRQELQLLSVNREYTDISSEKTVYTTSNGSKSKNISGHKNMIEQNKIIHDNVTHVNNNNDHNYDNVSLRHNNANIPVVTASNGDKNSKSQNVNNHSIKDHSDGNIILQKSLSSSWSTLKDIVTIKDEQMRMKAFQDLADSITNINLSFEPKNCTITKENTLDIPKIKNSYPSNIRENSDINLLSDMCDNSVFSLFNQSQESNIYLEKFTNDVCNRNSGANKIKQILIQENPFYNKIIKQLQSDFETATKWDENGMLNIHRAVISNRIYDVQRHLMVLEACNLNIDIHSEAHEVNLYNCFGNNNNNCMYITY